MRNPWWLRVFFVLVVLQALMLGRALIWPELIGQNLPWPATPLNARFVAALYLMGAISALLCAVSPRYAAVRVTLIEVGVLTGGLLLVTLPRLSEFSADTLPTRWLVFYTVDPVLAGLAWWRLRGRDTPPHGRRPLAGVAVAYSGMLAAAGAVMLVAPGFAVQVWPWALTTALAQVYSVFLLAFALGGFLVARDARWEVGWIWMVANLCTAVVIIVVSLASLERFTGRVSTSLWFLAFAAALLGLASLLVAGVRHRAGSSVRAAAP